MNYICTPLSYTLCAASIMNRQSKSSRPSATARTMVRFWVGLSSSDA